MTLLRKLTLIIVGVGVPALLLYMGSALWFARHGIRESVSAQQLELAHQAMNALDRELNDQMTYMQFMADSPQFITTATTAVPSGAARTAVTARLNDAIATTESWTALRVVGASGVIEVSTKADEVGSAYSTAGAYKAVADKAFKGTLAYSDVFRDPKTNEPTMLIAAPIGATASGTKAVLVGSVDWPYMLGLLQDTKSTAIELFNRDGYELGDSEATNSDEILTEKIPNAEIAALVLKGKEGTAETTSLFEDGGDALVLAAYVQQEGFRSYKGQGWVMITETSTATAYAAVNNLLPTLIPTFVAMALGIYVVVMALMYRTLIRPVKKVTEVTRRISAGDLSSRITVRSKDEIGQLGTSFNRMTDKLQELYRGLEAKVTAKTSELAERVNESETARARDEAILAGMREGLIALDSKGKVALVNVFAAQLFGFSRDSLFGKSLAEILDGLRDERDVAIEGRWRPEVQALETGKAISGDYLYHRYQTDGERLSININAAPIFANGSVAGVVLVVRDITKEKEVDRMKTEFISLASHQLRTPLSAIKWFSKMLANGDAGQLNDEQTEFAKNISESTERMIELVNSLLNISRIESGRIVIDPQPTDLKELVAGIVKDLQGKTQEKYQELIISVNDELPPINIDTHLVGQVYMNLLTNAIKYTHEQGKIMVLISRKDDQIVTQISDNGVGIPVEQQDKVFQKFFRADNVAKFETDGTGLGLYLVKAIVESSGGKIWFKSEEGKGTSFWFSLPAAGMQPKAGDVVLNE